ncbi:MAG TPA: phosphatidylserine decarboxylase, partial [Chitinophagales bacterium]|nr:phosphatidylserine decarboxylase [Chitinophagales bacterium]
RSLAGVGRAKNRRGGRTRARARRGREFLMETTTGKKYKVVQIAGFVARRIVDYTANEQEVKQGDVIGLIKFGSQVSVLLPHDVAVDVKVGDVTIDGESILGHEK